MEMSFKARSLVTILSAAVTIACVGISVRAQDNAPSQSHLDEARRFLELTEATQFMDRMFALTRAQSVSELKRRHADAPAPVVERFTTLLKQAFDRRKGLFLDEASTIYAKNLSEADLRSAVEFYSSEAGRSLVRAQPDLTSEVAVLGMRINSRIAGPSVREAIENLKKEGFDY